MPLPSGIRERWSSYPGCFARGTLDAGTALLLATLDDRPPPVRVLDYAAGTGPIAEEAASRWPAASVFGIEMDAIALAAARQNAPRCRFVLGSDLSALPGTFDLILSNPPFHVSRPREDAIWRQLIQDAPGRLERGGELRMVVQREVPAEPTLREAFKTVQRVAQTSGYDVWSAR